MTVTEVLNFLQNQGVVLSVQEGDLIVQGKRQALSDKALVQRIRDNKPALIELIRAGSYTPARSAAVQVPPNAIAPGSHHINPAMLPLVRLTQAQIDTIVAEVPGGAANVQDIYPLAPLQEGILLHHQSTEQGDMYIETDVLAFESRSRVDAFARALQAVIDRHDVLRTAIAWQGLAEPVQVVWRKAPLQVHELQLDAADGPMAEQLQQRFHPRHHRIDLRHAPLLQLHVAHDPATARWLVLRVNHHLWGDHTTNELMNEEIAAHLMGQADRLPPPLPFRNFVAQARLGRTKEEHEAFFRKMLGDVDESTAPFGLINLQGRLSDIAVACRQVDGDLALRMRRCARDAGVSVATLCHLAFSLVLARSAGRNDVVFGTLLFGRMQGGEGADRVLGLFLNSLPLRIRVGDASVQDSVHEVHRLLADLMRHEHAPLSLAQRCSAIAAPTPLFNASLNYRYSAVSQAPEKQLGDTARFSVASGDAQSELPLTLAVDDLGEGLELTAHVDASLDPLRICGYMETALAQLVRALEQAPATPLASLDVMPASERYQQLVEWNATNSPFACAQCVHEPFEAHAASSPQAMALVQGNQQLSYGALNAQANRLAHYLCDLGVGPDTRVAICMDRSLPLFVGLLAILKAGGAYVPLDPTYPPERLAYLLADSDPTVVLVDALGSKALGDAGGRPCIALDGADTPWADAPATNLPPHSLALTSTHLAYVIYTSGSTGQPKGVMATHQGVVSLAHAQSTLFDIPPTSRVLQFASQSFDACGFEMVMAFMPGATLVLAPSTPERWSGEAMSAYMAQQGVTHATLPPALLAQMPLHVPLPALRTLVLAGEAPNPVLVAAWAKGRQVFNAYGPTETTVWASAHRCSENASAVVPIGRPIANTRMYLLDDQMRPVPCGASGEIYIGGAGVTRGYLNRPELTAERFVPDPFGGEPAAHLYRTGDLGRSLPDGSIVFLGRNDFQVKLRGFRIELGEIEARLAEHSAIREAVVVDREDAAGERQLVAYYTEVEPGDDLDWNQVFANILGGDGPDEGDAAKQMAKQLRAHLAVRLPDYMVPSAYVKLPAIPLTPNGKLDRKALPNPDGSAVANQRYEAPQGQTEVIVARVWTDVLKIERIGRHDNVFDLGAHSMLLPAVVGMLRRDDFRINVMDIFPHPTVASLAAHLQQLALTQTLNALSDSVVVVRKTGSQRPLFLVHETHGLDMYFPVVARHIDPDIPVYGLPGMPLDGPQLQTMAELAARMVHIIRSVQPEGPVRVAGWSFGGMLAYEIGAQLLARGDAVEFIGLLDTEVIFDQICSVRPDTAQGILLLSCEGQADEASNTAKRNAYDSLREAAPTMDYAQLFARCAEAQLLPHYIAHMNATEAQQYLARLVAHENAIEAYTPHAAALPVRIFVAQEEADPDNEYLGWDKLLSPQHLGLVRVQGNHRTMVEVHAETLGQAISGELMSGAARGAAVQM